MAERIRYRRYNFGSYDESIEDENARTFETALYMAERMNLSEGIRAQDPDPVKRRKMIRADAMVRIVQDWMGSNAIEYHHALNVMLGDTYLSQERLFCLERHGFRCARCAHSNSHRDGVEVHHIIPKGYAGPEIWWFDSINHRDNLIPLCIECHAKVTNPPNEHWHWRRVAIKFLEMNGRADLSERLAKEPDRSESENYKLWQQGLRRRDRSGRSQELHAGAGGEEPDGAKADLSYRERTKRQRDTR